MNDRDKRNNDDDEVAKRIQQFFDNRGIDASVETHEIAKGIMRVRVTINDERGKTSPHVENEKVYTPAEDIEW